MAAPKRVTVEMIMPLIDHHKGNLSAIARSLGVHRSTIQRRLAESPVLAAARQDARETMLDMAESVLYKKVLEGSTPELIFFLKTQGFRRGYTERQEITGANGGPLQTVNAHMAIDPRTLTDDELSGLTTILERAQNRIGAAATE